MFSKNYMSSEEHILAQLHLLLYLECLLLYFSEESSHISMLFYFFPCPYSPMMRWLYKTVQEEIAGFSLVAFTFHFVATGILFEDFKVALVELNLQC